MPLANNPPSPDGGDGASFCLLFCVVRIPLLVLFDCGDFPATVPVGKRIGQKREIIPNQN